MANRSSQCVPDEGCEQPDVRLGHDVPGQVAVLRQDLLHSVQGGEQLVDSLLVRLLYASHYVTQLNPMYRVT